MLFISSSPEEALQGVELDVVLSLIVNYAVLSSHVAFFWCMWKLGERSEYCVTLDKALQSCETLQLGHAKLYYVVFWDPSSYFLILVELVV